MQKEEISALLSNRYNEFKAYVNELSKDEYEYAPEGKWHAGQHAEHLLKSVKPVASGLGMPKFLIRQKFGKANRPSKTYDALVARYREKLELGPVYAKAYAPGDAGFNKKDKGLKALIEALDKLVAKLSKWSEEQLDEYIFPHPLLGKVTVREMLYFTAYHAAHHQQLIKRGLKGV